jgi:uncharacterized protein (TIGR00266 family)
MNYTITERPDYAMANLVFERAGETITVESGAMVARDSGVEMKTSMKGGFMAAAKRKLLGGESLFTNTFTSTAAGQRLFLAPAPEGDIEVMDLASLGALIMQSGAFVAADTDVNLNTKYAGFKGFLSGAGLFFLEASGQGRVFVNSYGGIHRVELDGTNPYIVDTSHIVAFTPGLDFQIRKIGGMKSLFLSGEGLVCHFTGRGTLWLQTRNPGSLASFLDAFRPTKSSSSGSSD